MFVNVERQALNSMSHEGVSHHRMLDYSFGNEIKSLGGPKGAECTMNTEPSEAAAVQQPIVSFTESGYTRSHLRYPV